MQFRDGASVFTADGEEVGKIDYVVLDPKTQEITCIVVRKGILLAEDKVVPVDWVISTAEDSVTLREDVGDFEELPKFEEHYVVPLGERELARMPAAAGNAPPLYWYPPHGAPPAPFLPPSAPPPPREEALVTKRHVPDDTVVLKEGADVIDADGQNVGNVESITTDPETDQVTHFVISKGLLLEEEKVIPSRWIDTLSEEHVYLAVGSGLIESLPEYRVGA